MTLLVRPLPHERGGKRGREEGIGLRQGIAVGTALAGGPPHRSVREELPHTAPPLGDDGQDVAVPTCRRRQAVKVLARSGAVSGASATMTSFPLGDSLSSADSATGVPALFAHFVGTMEPSDFPPVCMPAVPSVRFSDRPRTPMAFGEPMGSPGSRAWSFREEGATHLFDRELGCPWGQVLSTVCRQGVP